MNWLALGIEVVACIMLALAALEGFVRWLYRYGRRDTDLQARRIQEDLRVQLGERVITALTFLVAADVIRSAIETTWDELAKLLVIVFLRTAVSFFLQKELDQIEARRRQPAEETTTT